MAFWASLCQHLQDRVRWWCLWMLGCNSKTRAIATRDWRKLYSSTHELGFSQECLGDCHAMQLQWQTRNPFQHMCLRDPLQNVLKFEFVPRIQHVKHIETSSSLRMIEYTENLLNSRERFVRWISLCTATSQLIGSVAQQSSLTILGGIWTCPEVRFFQPAPLPNIFPDLRPMNRSTKSRDTAVVKVMEIQEPIHLLNTQHPSSAYAYGRLLVSGTIFRWLEIHPEIYGNHKAAGS